MSACRNSGCLEGPAECLFDNWDFGAGLRVIQRSYQLFQSGFAAPRGAEDKERNWMVIAGGESGHCGEGAQSGKRSFVARDVGFELCLILGRQRPVCRHKTCPGLVVM